MYYGEEIQMRGIRGSESTDAARRQAMLWGEGESKCKQPENFTYANQVTVGVKEALTDGWSMKSGQLDYANPTQTVNYASCHDNYTNYDQMNYTLNYNGTTSTAADSTEAMEASVASMASVLFSEGIAFTQGGEEIFRQKLLKADDPYFSKADSGDYVSLKDGTKLMRNSYMYGDAVNSFKWDRKITYNKYFELFKAASLARQSVLNDILGRQYDGTSKWGAKGISGWDDAISHGPGP